jgi:hypothetical protein
MRIVILVFMFFTSHGNAEKLSLVCNAFQYSIETELNEPLKENFVRYVGQTIAGFLNADTYSLRISTECEGKGEEKVCLNVSDSHYCPRPTDTFKFRSLKEDQSVVMISDRCDGSWTKYQLISQGVESSGVRAYMEDRTFFQLKNQIYAGVSIQKDKPVLLVGSGNKDLVDIRLVSFRKDLWNVAIYDPLRDTLKVSLESYENDIHESIALRSECKYKF